MDFINIYLNLRFYDKYGVISNINTVLLHFKFPFAVVSYIDKTKTAWAKLI